QPSDFARVVRALWASLLFMLFPEKEFTGEVTADGDGHDDPGDFFEDLSAFGFSFEGLNTVIVVLDGAAEFFIALDDGGDAFFDKSEFQDRIGKLLELGFEGIEFVFDLVEF
ncbi:hypothetical protein, partial [Endozoicomonas atrinae]|uniref:hypothetical protein n=1 Tax=Endozoicomonas atrinae TaxID=1333660 RepID=UPI000B1F282C